MALTKARLLAIASAIGSNGLRKGATVYISVELAHDLYDGSGDPEVRAVLSSLVPGEHIVRIKDGVLSAEVIDD